MAISLRKSASQTFQGVVAVKSVPAAGSRRGNADGVRAAAEALFQMMDVLQHGEDFVAPVVDAEERADADVVDAGLHGAVHDGGAPVVVGLAAAGMDPSVGGAVVRLLEALVGADAAGLQLAEVLDRERRDVDVDAANLAVAAARGVDGLDGLVDVVEAVGVGIGLAGDHEDALVALLDDDLDLGGDLFLGEGDAVQLAVAGAVGAVFALVGAAVADVERGEHDQAGAVDLLLDGARGGKELFGQLRVLESDEGCDLVEGEALHLAGLGEDGADAGGFGLRGVAEAIEDCLVVDVGGLFGDCCHRSSSARLDGAAPPAIAAGQPRG